MPIYLDHTATSKPTPAVIACVTDLLPSLFGNPSSIHEAGRAADRRLQSDRNQMAQDLGCSPDLLFLTSGGTESINTAVKGIFMRRAKKTNRLIISAGEHAATHETAAFLKQWGVTVSCVPITAKGTVDLDALESALHEPAALISLIHVSNETGAINPVSEITALRNRLQPETPIHLDTVQTWGKMPFSFDESGVELLSGSGHKLGAPKGIGWLIKKKNVLIEPLLHGGGQQEKMRSGTENPVLAAALATALREKSARLESDRAFVQQLRNRFLDQIEQTGIPNQVLSPPDGIPHILSVAFPGLRGETLVNALSAEGIYFSSGAACSSRRNKKNQVLTEMGLPEKLIQSAVRISFSEENTVEEIDETAFAIAKAYRRLVR